MARAKKSRRRSAGGNGTSSAVVATGRSQDAEALLRADHRKVEKLFKQFDSTQDERQKRDLAQQACRELVIHTMLEEGTFYPACREKKVESELLDEAQVEHDSVKLLVAELMNGGLRDPYYEAKVTVLSEYVNHHVKEEEKRGTGIFARARRGGVDMVELGERLREARQDINERAGSVDILPSRPRALQLGSGSGMFNRNQEMEMPRDRDERGRFMDEDDDRGNSRGRSSRGRYEDDDNNGGRGRGRGGWFGDPESHSRAAQQRGSSSGRYEDDYGDRGGRDGRGGSRERDEQGRFMRDDEGNGGRGGGRERDEQGRFMSDDDDDGGRGGRGGSRGGGRGWFGDSEGHSRAAQQRGSPSGRYEDDYDDRGGRGGRGGGRERDEQGRFMSDDDDGGRGGSRGGPRGWFGDSEGRSRSAQQRGFSSGRYDDEDDDRNSGGGRGGRGVGRERDEQGRFTSDDDDGGRGGRGGGRGRGHGGWFGDPRGHSEASRQGWRNRD